ncbi:MAG: MFS transporter [Promethearchaeota archaeon]
MDDSLETRTEDFKVPPHPSDDQQGMYQVWMLAISLSILQIGFGIITPIFPFYIDELGVGGFELGVLAASFAVTRILLASPLGGSSDRFGRKPILVIALFGFAIANFIYAAAQDIYVMIGARALEGAVSAGFFPAANAFVSDMTTPENRGAAMGYISMGNMIGFLLGPTLGGVLAQYLGTRIPFVVAGFVTLATLVILYLIVKEPERRFLSRKEKVPIRDALGQQKRPYAVLALTMYANMFAIGILEVAFLLDAVQRLDIQPIEIGAFFGVLGIITIIGNIGFGKLSDRIGRKWLITVGSFIAAVSLYLFMTVNDLVGLVAVGIVLGIAMSMRGPTIQALIADLTDPRAYGSVMGVFGAVSNAAYVVGPVLGGRLYDDTGSAMSSLAIAGIVSIMGAVAAGTGLPADRPTTMESPSEEDSQL